MEQRSAEWFKARCGKATASRIADVMAKLKSGGEAAGRRNYRAQLVAERLTGVPADSYTNGAMQWGIDNEESAIECYEFVTGHDVETVGFIIHPEIEMSGASPDGLIGDDGLLEVKCPNTATHIDYLLSGSAPADYILQMQWQMACTGRQWCDFISYDPRMPVEHQLFVARVDRDEDKIEEIYSSVKDFLLSVDEVVEKLTKLRAA